MLTDTTAPVRCRWMVTADVPELARIDRLAFAAHPWDEAEFRIASRERNVVIAVADLGDGRPVGYMVYDLHVDCWRVIKVATHPAYRRLRIASKLIRVLIAKLNRPPVRKRIDALVRESNLSAQLFLRSCGFAATGIERHAYAEPAEDGYAFEFRAAPPYDGPLWREWPLSVLGLLADVAAKVMAGCRDRVGSLADLLGGGASFGLSDACLEMVADAVARVREANS